MNNIVLCALKATLVVKPLSCKRESKFDGKGEGCAHLCLPIQVAIKREQDRFNLLENMMPGSVECYRYLVSRGQISCKHNAHNLKINCSNQITDVKKACGKINSLKIKYFL